MGKYMGKVKFSHILYYARARAPVLVIFSFLYREELFFKKCFKYRVLGHLLALLTVLKS